MILLDGSHRAWWGRPCCGACSPRVSRSAAWCAIPRRLGPDRVRVQITLGDLSNPVALRQAVRGASAVVHLAATIRDQPAGSIEELNGLATARLLRHARAAGVERFVFFGAMGADAELAGTGSSARRRSPSRPCSARASTRPFWPPRSCMRPAIPG